MKHHPITNPTFRNVGAGQGYIGVDVRMVAVDCPVNGPGTPAVEMALMPTPAELAALNEGKPLILQQLGPMVTPFLAYVEGVDYSAEEAEGG